MSVSLVTTQRFNDVSHVLDTGHLGVHLARLGLSLFACPCRRWSDHRLGLDRKPKSTPVRAHVVQRMSDPTERRRTAWRDVRERCHLFYVWNCVTADASQRWCCGVSIKAVHLCEDTWAGRHGDKR